MATITVTLVKDCWIAGVKKTAGSSVTIERSLAGELITNGIAAKPSNWESSVSGGSEVFAEVNSTGGIEYFKVGEVIAYTESSPYPRGQAVTAAGSFTGNATTQSIDLGWSPDFVVCKTNAADNAIWVGRCDWHDRSDSFVYQQSYGDGITLTETGFSVGANSRCNRSGGSVRYFAYRDNGASGFLQSSFSGNNTSGRLFSVFEGRDIAAMMIKRDALPSPVWAFKDQTAYYYVSGVGMAVSTGTSLGANGVLTCGSGAEINEWHDNIGEGMAVLAFPAESDSTVAFVYEGDGVTGRRVTLPWEPEAFIVVPLETAASSGSSTAGRLWMSMLSGGSNHMFLSNAADTTGVFAGVAGASIALQAENSVNASGKKYGVVAWKKSRRSAFVDVLQAPCAYRHAVQLAEDAYIDCGTDESLNISGPRTFEFLGQVYTPSTAKIAGGGGRNDEVDKQVAIMFRSSGADAVGGNISYGFEVCTPQAYAATDGGVWAGSTILIATHDKWDLANGAGDVLDNNPMNTGVVVEQRKQHHIVITQDGAGGIIVQLNGRVVKERRRDLVAAIGKDNCPSFAGHSLIFGGRKRVTVDHANGLSLRVARIWSRALSASEMQALWRRVADENQAIPADFAEEWDAENATSTTLVATRSAANNGTYFGSVSRI